MEQGQQFANGGTKEPMRMLQWALGDIVSDSLDQVIGAQNFLLSETTVFQIPIRKMLTQ